jgi:predicted hotdog family 3-hydroxylacyl-ACP dehydratase
MYKEKELEKILPHKFPMILINRVIDFDMENKILTSETDITPETMFFDQAANQVPAWVGIEYMAQTIAALSGIFSLEFEKTEVKMGFVIGTRNYESFVSGFKAGQCLSVKVEQLFFDSELGSFNCAIFDGTRKLAQAQLNVFQPSSTTNFLPNE